MKRNAFLSFAEPKDACLWECRNEFYRAANGFLSQSKGRRLVSKGKFLNWDYSW